MTLIAINTFQGEIPRSETNLLPDNAASEAINVDTRTGALQSLARTSPVSAVEGSVQAMYTEDGLRFFTWPTDVDAHKSLVIGDSHQRIYFTDGTAYFGTTGNQMSPAGGPPVTAWRQGVPYPTLVQTNIINSTSWPDGVSISATTFYESDGVKYQVSEQVSLTNVGIGDPPNQEVGRKYRFAMSAIYLGILNPETKVYEGNGTTPETASPVLQIIGKRGNETLFTIYSEGSTFVRSDQPAKLIIAKDRATLTFTAEIEWGANGLIGKGTAKKTSAYVATLVNTYLEESAPSDPIIVTTDYLQTIQFAVTTPALDGFAAITRIRIYETITGSQDTAYHLSKEYNPGGSLSGSNLLDVNNALATVGPTLETIGWDVPPLGLSGLTPTPFGSYAAFRNNELYLTEQYRPHTMPSKYVMSFPNAIKAIKQTAHGLIVVTTARGYMVSGVSPDSVARTELPVRASITSKRAIAEYGNMAWYASEDGLVMVQGGSASLEPSQRLFTREIWRKKFGASLENLVLAANDGYLIGLFPDRNGFMVRLDEAVGEFIEITPRAQCAFVLPQTDGLYMGTTNGIQQFAGDSSGLFGTWVSKQFTVVKPLNFSVLEVSGEEGSSFFYEVYGDNALRASGGIIAKDSGAFVRLPGGYKAQKWRVSIQMAGYGEKLRRVVLAETPAELASA